jgi:hypothetical protein
MGVSGVGKSKLLEALAYDLFHQDLAFSMVDPHQDSSEALLARFTSEGLFARDAGFERLLYVEFAEEGPFIPFNVLKQTSVSAHTLASNVLEAFHRAWPALGEGAAPQFDNLVLAGTMVLIENELPLPSLHRLLTDGAYREGLLGAVADPDTLAFFHDRFSRWSRSEAPQLIESTLRRLFLLTFSPVLKYSLGQTENRLDFRRILDGNQSVIFNLGRIRDHDARRLLGCLITIGYESAALSRGPNDVRTQHHLLLDEFSDYSAQSEEALAAMLSQTRKFGLFCTMAHQTWSQASARLQGALQNVGVKIAMRLGRQDAEVMARTLGAVNPLEIKSEALSPRSQPIFMELASQWEGWVRTLVDLKERQAIVKVADRPAVHIRTITVPTPRLDHQTLDAIKRTFRQRLMVEREAITLTHQAPAHSSRVKRTTAT